MRRPPARAHAELTRGVRQNQAVIEYQHALEKASPAHVRSLAHVVEGLLTGLLYRARRDRSAQFGVRGEHSMDVDQVQPGAVSGSPGVA